MANLWSSLFGRSKETRLDPSLSMEDWSKYFTFGGVNYPIRYGSSHEKREQIENDFQGYVQGAFKRNPVVFACCITRQMVFTEARFQFQQIRQGRPQDLFGTKELDILENPWPNGTTGDLLARAIQDVDMAGNFYCVREGKRLRRLRPDWVDIILSGDPELDSDVDVVGYVYRPGRTEDRSKWKIYPITGENGKVAHWAPIPDPEAQYRGMSWITPVVREIEGDSAATTHKLKFFQNGATPSMAISFKETVTAEQFKEFVGTLEESHVGLDNAYGPMYLGGGADVTPLTKDLAQLDFKKTQGAGETRIAMAAGVHPVVAGLAEGMQGASLNAGNFKSARDMFADSRMRPLWRSISASLSVLIKVPENARLWYDTRDIAFLQDDNEARVRVQSEKATAMTKLIQDGYEPMSIIEAIEKEDMTLLKHTGLYSVQLQPPMPDGPPDPANPDAAKPHQTPLQNKQAAAAKKAAKAADPAAAKKPAAPAAKPAPTKPATPKGTPKK